MYQRPANVTRARVNTDTQDRLFRDFIETCKTVLEDAGDADAAFRFEMVLDHLNSGSAISADKKTVSKILGL